MTLATLAQFASPLRAILATVDAEGLVTGLASGERCVDTQARVMAGREAASPGWIQGTYRDTPTKRLVVAAVDALTVPRDVAAIEAAIEGAFAQGDPAEMSRHLPNAEGLAEAADLLPAGEGPLAARLRELVASGVARGELAPHSCVLTNESGAIVCHVQCWTV